jgi:hypothetical protein
VTMFAALADTALAAPTDLGTLGGSYSAAHAARWAAAIAKIADLNDSGQSVGISSARG